MPSYSFQIENCSFRALYFIISEILLILIPTYPFPKFFVFILTLQTINVFLTCLYKKLLLSVV
ncbi:Uncharacterised protein [Segatella copri]|nr:Uncharacterised protein [Segatella copri]